MENKEISIKEKMIGVALHTFIHEENISMVKSTLNVYKDFDLNYKDLNGRTALMIAVDSQNFDMVKFLLEQNSIRINEQDNNGWTALHFAAHHHSATISQLLIEEGCSVFIKNNKGELPLEVRIYDQIDYACVKIILDGMKIKYKELEHDLEQEIRAHKNTFGQLKTYEDKLRSLGEL